jgi:large subunit ribosomal protein L1
MVAISKRQKTFAKKVNSTKLYAVDEALRLAKECATAKFEESMDVAVNLGVNMKQSDQMVRGATVLPHGTGRSVRVAVFARPHQADQALKAGADIVGLDDLVESIQGGKMDFDLVIAAPDTMPVVAKLGPVLGPRGLMPNPKIGTVTNDLAQAVKNAKQGQVRYRTDKAGIIHCTFGKANFSENLLKENLETLLLDIKKAKPSTAKGTYFRKMAISSTMGPCISIDLSTLTVLA